MTENGSQMTAGWVRLHGFAGDEITVYRHSVVAVLPMTNAYVPCTTVALEGGHKLLVKEHLSEVLVLLGITPGESPKNHDKVYREAFERQAQQIAEQMRTINENDLKIKWLQEELAATRIASSAKDDQLRILRESLTKEREACERHCVVADGLMDDNSALRKQRDMLKAQLQQTTEALKKVQGDLDAARVELNRLRCADYWRGDGWKITWSGTGTSDSDRSVGLGDYAKWPGTKD